MELLQVLLTPGCGLAPGKPLLTDLHSLLHQVLHLTGLNVRSSAVDFFTLPGTPSAPACAGWPRVFVVVLIVCMFGLVWFFFSCKASVLVMEGLSGVLTTVPLPCWYTPVSPSEACAGFLDFPHSPGGEET